MSPARLLAPTGGGADQTDFTLRRVQRLMQISVGLIALVFGVQSFAIALAGGTGLTPVLGELVLAVCMVSLLGVIVCNLVGRGASIANGVFAALYLLVLVLWPIAERDGVIPSDHPWTWFLCSLACACAVQAWNQIVAAGYVALASIGYGVSQILVMPPSEESLTTALLDTSYALVMGYLIVTLWMLFRTAAVTLDETRTAALLRYDEAVRQDTISAERIAVDGIVHDSVLAALQQAARADGPAAGAAARSMASRAIAVLVSAPTLDQTELDQRTSVQLLRRELVERVAAIDPGIRVVSRLEAELRPLPRDAAEALIRATLQALANSIAHAGDDAVHRSVTLTGGAAGVTVVVADDGVGFEPSAVDARRIGLRVSIIERMAVFGGDVVLDTAPGRGTSITLRWPAPEDGAGEQS